MMAHYTGWLPLCKAGRRGGGARRGRLLPGVKHNGGKAEVSPLSGATPRSTARPPPEYEPHCELRYTEEIRSGIMKQERETDG